MIWCQKYFDFEVKGFLPFVANAERIQNMHIRMWSANGWCCIICILWTRTSSFPMASVALTFKICTKVDPLHDVLAWIASLNISIRLIATEGSFVWKIEIENWKKCCRNFSCTLTYIIFTSDVISYHFYIWCPIFV